MKKIALYIDTSSLFNGGVTGLDVHIKSLIKLLENNDDIELLVNDILQVEIQQNIKKMVFPKSKLKAYLNSMDIERTENLYRSQQKKYLSLIDSLYKVGRKIDVGISNKDVVEGVKRQYNDITPWKNGKSNEWKDFFVQCALLRYSESETCKIIVSTRDNDFDSIKNNRVDVQKTPLKDLLPYLELYLEKNKDDFKTYLISKIYSDLEYDIMDRVLELSDSEEIFVGIENDDEPEITIEDIKILDIKDKKRIPILVEANIYGFVGNYRVDDYRGEVYGVKSNKAVEYKMFCSFEGNFNHLKFTENYMNSTSEDNNTITLITDKN